MSVSLFESKSFVYLKALQNDLRKQRYTPGPVKRVLLRREVGSPRPLGILNLRDSIVHRALVQILIPVFEPDFDDYSHAYRTGYSTQTAIALARQHAGAGRPWMVKLDLQDCFGNIPRRPLLKSVKTKVRDFAIRRLLNRLLAASIITESRSGLRQIMKPKGLLQGSPLSPMLANIYLAGFDRSARRLDLRFVRYGDDIAIFTSSRPDAERALDIAIRISDKMLLPINKEKTKLFNLHKGCTYLGEWLSLNSRIPAEDKK
jgi:group II intron reverse transcriptase/maturase